MSFRYTNYMTGVCKQRILLHRALSSISLRTYIGRSSGSGVQVQCSAYGKLLDISIDESCRNDFMDEHGIVQAHLLSNAIRSALFDANTKVRHDKEEAYRESIRGSPELLKNDEHYELWYANNGSSLPPFCYESVRDEPVVEALQEKLKKQQQESSSSSSSSSSQKKEENTKLSMFGEIRAEANDSNAACMPELAGALLQLEKPVVVAEKQKMRMDDAETTFWQRVDLIRRAQINTIGYQKRRYEEFESSAKTNEFGEKVKMNFIP